MGKGSVAENCFYCGALVEADPRKERGDHFPLAKRHGGKLTVPCCYSCHDMKDRFNLFDWPSDWVSKILEDFPKVGRETKIFLAKALDIIQDAKPRSQAEATLEDIKGWAQAHGAPSFLGPLWSAGYAAAKGTVLDILAEGVKKQEATDD